MPLVNYMLLLSSDLCTQIVIVMWNVDSLLLTKAMFRPRHALHFRLTIFFVLEYMQRNKACFLYSSHMDGANIFL